MRCFRRDACRLGVFGRVCRSVGLFFLGHSRSGSVFLFSDASGLGCRLNGGLLGSSRLQCQHRRVLSFHRRFFSRCLTHNCTSLAQLVNPLLDALSLLAQSSLHLLGRGRVQHCLLQQAVAFAIQTEGLIPLLGVAHVGVRCCRGLENAHTLAQRVATFRRCDWLGCRG